MEKNKKYTLTSIGVIILFALVSCMGGSDNKAAKEAKELILKAVDTKISGDLRDCYEVVDKNYKVKFPEESYEDYIITVELKRTSKELPYDRDNVVIFPDADKSSAEYCAGFGIDILNADGDVIDKINAKSNSVSWDEDEMTTVLQLLPDETTTIAFEFDDLSGATNFRIRSLVQKNEKRKTTLSKEVNSVVDLAKKAAELSEDADLKEAQKDAEKALKATGEALEVAGKMLDLLGN